jgi:hypothetical protein
VCSGAAETFSLSESTGCKPKGKHQARFNKKIGFHGILLKKNPVLTSNPKLYSFSLIWNSIHINGVVVKNNTELAFSYTKRPILRFKAEFFSAYKKTPHSMCEAPFSTKFGVFFGIFLKIVETLSG